MNILYGLQWYGDIGLLALRIAVGAIFLKHGLSKRGMWKMQPSAEMPTGMIRIMRVLSIVEPIAGTLVLAGLFTQIAAAALSIVMLGALYFKIFVWKNKFINGWELDQLILASNIALITLGGGLWSIDRWFLGL